MTTLPVKAMTRRMGSFHLQWPANCLASTVQAHLAGWHLRSGRAATGLGSAIAGWPAFNRVKSPVERIVRHTIDGPAIRGRRARAAQAAELTGLAGPKEAAKPWRQLG